MELRTVEIFPEQDREARQGEVNKESMARRANLDKILTSILSSSLAFLGTAVAFLLSINRPDLLWATSLIAAALGPFCVFQAINWRSALNKGRKACLYLYLRFGAKSEEMLFVGEKGTLHFREFQQLEAAATYVFVMGFTGVISGALTLVARSSHIWRWTTWQGVILDCGLGAVYLLYVAIMAGIVIYFVRRVDIRQYKVDVQRMIEADERAYEEKKAQEQRSLGIWTPGMYSPVAAIVRAIRSESLTPLSVEALFPPKGHCDAAKLM